VKKIRLYLTVVSFIRRHFAAPIEYKDVCLKALTRIKLAGSNTSGVTGGVVGGGVGDNVGLLDGKYTSKCGSGFTG
jgi:hypothetical protein